MKSNLSFPSTSLKNSAVSSIAALVSTTAAQAVIVTNTDLSLSGFTSSAVSSIPWDIDNAGGAEVVLDHPNARLHLASVANGFRPVAFNNSLGDFLFNMTYGANVATAAPAFASGGINSVLYYAAFSHATGFSVNTPGYIGFQFNPSGTVLYGWASVVFNDFSGSNAKLQITAWAYEDSGATILVGQTVPEPETTAVGLGALALGTAGLRRWRKAKSRNQAV